MMSRGTIYAILLTILSPLAGIRAGGVGAERYRSVDFDSERYFSFEKGTGPVEVLPGRRGGKSTLSLNTALYKTGGSSLQWDFGRNGATLLFRTPVPYLGKNPDPKETSVSTFVFWVCSKEKYEGGTLRFSFLKNGRECCHFVYKLGFTGWRGAWVAFDRDMEGTPEEGMDCFTVSVEGVGKGSLLFDGVIPAAFEDIRHHTPDFQAPYVNADTDMHWLLLNRNWEKSLDMVPPAVLSEAQLEDMDSIRTRLLSLIMTPGKKVPDYDRVVEMFHSYEIQENEDGSVSGKPIFFTRYGETFLNLGIDDASVRFRDAGMLLRAFNDNLLDVALCRSFEKDPGRRENLDRIYVLMTKHLLYQGFAAGSGQGTLHHLGYSMRNFYTAPIIMKDVLVRHSMDAEVQKAMEWFSGVGEVKQAPVSPGMDIDAFNTYLIGRTAALVMLPDTPYKYAYLKALSRWIDNGFRYTEGLGPSFKRDGSVFHHRRSYPAYAVGGLDGAVQAVWLLRGTDMAVSRTSHEILKQALMEMRFYCNEKSFPLALSGRHPDGEGALIPKHYALLAEAGSPDGSCPVDADLARAYLRLAGGEETGFADKFRSLGFEAEKSPVGTKVYGYNSSVSVRGGDWLVTIAGHSRYLWSAEIYRNANMYGRYLTHGSMQIIGPPAAWEEVPAGDGPEISAKGSGYAVEGFDWCHIPGTTAAERPLEEMRAEVLNVDEHSGYEEMLLSDEWFAGGVSHLHGFALEAPGLQGGGTAATPPACTGKGRYAAYAMRLHEHDKYNGSLRALKSFFAFGNRIICLGSGLENTLPSSGLHTTLFQNTTDTLSPTGLNGKEIVSLSYRDTSCGPRTLVLDRFRNAWIVKDAKVVLSRGRQDSFHEETCEPTSGIFEKAYIHHWDTDASGRPAGAAPGYDRYEYLTLIRPDESQLKECLSEPSYKVLRQDSSVHAVHDLPSGVTAAAVFGTSCVDDLVAEAGPCMLMYSFDPEDNLVLSVSNPDLALYEGLPDEVFDKAGNRIERSVYSRSWIDNPCGPTHVRLKLAGSWALSGYSGRGTVSLESKDGFTEIYFITSEARTEEITLKRK